MQALIGWQWEKCSDINANCDPWYGFCKCNIPAQLNSECSKFYIFKEALFFLNQRIIHRMIYGICIYRHFNFLQ